MIVLLVIALIVYVIYNAWQERYLAKKLGAKPPVNVESDGRLGFNIGKRIMAASKVGRTMEVFMERYSELPHPEVQTFKTKLYGTDLFQTADPENVKALLATQFKDFGLGLRNKMFLPFLGKGIFTLDGDGWKHSRELLRPLFIRERISHLHILELHIERLFATIRSQNGARFNILDIINRLSLEYSTEFLFGTSLSALDSEDTELIGEKKPDVLSHDSRFGKAFDFCQVYTAYRVLVQKLYWLLNSKEYQESCSTVREFADKYVTRALALSPEELEKKSESNYIFLYELVKQTRDPNVIRDQLLNILIAGRDTTAALITFSVMILAQRPEVFRKLKSEIEERFGTKETTNIADIGFESLKSCEYLKNFLNEVLRLHPPVPKNARVANKDTTLPHGGGPEGLDPILIRKGQNVIYCIYVMHRNQAIYGEDANEFRPERWSEPRCRKLGWAYLPFNGGPRICLGQQFALTEASYVLVRLLQQFEGFEMDQEIKFDALLTMMVRDGLYVSVKE